MGLDAGCFETGYVTDFGATYIAGREPTAPETNLARRWTEVADRVTADRRAQIPFKAKKREIIAFT